MLGMAEVVCLRWGGLPIFVDRFEVSPVSRSTSRSRAFFGGVPWWVIVGVPVAMIVARFVLEGLGVPTAPAVLGLFTALFAGFSVAVVRRRGWSVAWRTSVLPGAGGLVAGRL